MHATTFKKEKLDNAPTPEVPEPFRVRESKQRFQAALNKACDALEEKEIRKALGSPLFYWRYLAKQSLARRGKAGLKIAVEGLDDKEWKVRSACCDAIASIFISNSKRPDEKSAPSPKEVDAILDKLTKLMEDENPWVRYLATGALGTSGRKSDNVNTALVKAAADPNPWVRAQALSAISKLVDNPELLKTAAISSMKIPTTDFSTTSRSISLIEKSGIRDKAVLNALIFVIENPGEGMESENLNKFIKMMVEIDTEGETAIPLLTKVAKGGYVYDRLRGNPKKTAIELLGKYGPKAVSSTEVLKTIASSEPDKKNKDLPAAAKTALEQINEK